MGTVLARMIYWCQGNKSGVISVPELLLLFFFLHKDIEMRSASSFLTSASTPEAPPGLSGAPPRRAKSSPKPTPPSYLIGRHTES